MNVFSILFLPDKEEIEELLKSLEDGVNYMDHCQSSQYNVLILQSIKNEL